MSERDSGALAASFDAYTELFEVACDDVQVCAEACAERGGEAGMCEASECQANTGGPRECLPPPVWSNLESIRVGTDDVFETVQLVVVFGEYHDLLLLDQFKLEVPAAAEIRGITVDVRKAGEDAVADDTVRIVKEGVVGAPEPRTRGSAQRGFRRGGLAVTGSGQSASLPPRLFSRRSCGCRGTTNDRKFCPRARAAGSKIAFQSCWS